MEDHKDNQSAFQWRIRKAHRQGRNRQLNISGGVYAKRTAIGETDNLIFPVAMRLGETPVPIPNTMVKP